MTTTPLPAIGYIRVGSAGPGLAGELQKQRIKEWAIETGHEIAEWVEELGVPRAGRGFDGAVAHCRGKLIVAVAPVRISRDLAVLREQIGRVRAAGGRLGFVEGWQETELTPGTLMELAIAMADTETGAPRVATYRRVAQQPEADQGPQQQVAAAWDYLEERGLEILSIDGAEFGRDPRELLDES
jgi:hypothetical protein